MDIFENQYVSIINIHKLKGAELIIYLLNNINNIPFLVVKSEHGSEKYDELIKNIIEKKNETEKIKSIYMNRVNDPKKIYKEIKFYPQKR